MIQNFTLPLHVVSESNMRENWVKAHKRHKNQKTVIKWELHVRKCPRYLPVQITLTRLSSRLLDDDNLQSAFKYVRDAIAEHFITGKAPGRADDDKRLTWIYSQEKSTEKGIKISFDFLDPSPSIGIFHR
jgi:hypothetical protein